MGGYREDFNLMFIGRIVFGIGCEVMYVAQSSIVSVWFINYELPFGMSMITCIPLVGSFIGGAVVPHIYTNSGFGDAFFAGFEVCAGCMVLVICVCILDHKAEKHDRDLLERYKKEKL